MELAGAQEIIATYGYAALFAGTFLEGETFFILGGIAARQGLLDPIGVALAALGGAFLGDNFFFLLGRWKGALLLARSRRLARKAVAARRLVRRHAVLLLLLSRFLYGLRTVIPLCCGAAGLHPLKFLLLNLVSALCWTALFGGLGYYFGGWLMGNADAMRGLQMAALLAVAVVVLGLIAARLVQRRLLGPEGRSGPTS